jgi:hypothetical protein
LPVRACEGGSQGSMHGQGIIVYTVTVAEWLSRPLQPWGSCRGSSPATRGYTCGLWLLFHTLAAHVTGDTGGALWMAAIK